MKSSTRFSYHDNIILIYITIRYPSSYLPIFHVVDLDTDVNQLHEVLQTEVQNLDVTEHLLIDFSTDILRVEIKRLFSKITQQDDSLADELLLDFQVSEVKEEL